MPEADAVATARSMTHKKLARNLEGQGGGDASSVVLTDKLDKLERLATIERQEMRDRAEQKEARHTKLERLDRLDAEDSTAVGARILTELTESLGQMHLRAHQPPSAQPKDGT